MQSAKRRRKKVGKPRINRDVHICAKTLSDAFTVRPNVDRARKEPSKMKWMSASNVCFTWDYTSIGRAATSRPSDPPHQRNERNKTVFGEVVWTYEPDEGDAVLPARVLGE